MIDARQGTRKHLIWQAVEHAFETRWRGIRNEASYWSMLGQIAAFLEARCKCLDEVTTADVAAMVAHFTRQGNAPRTVKSKVGLLRMVFEAAAEADPPLASKAMPKRRVAVPKTLKWWLTPEDQLRLTSWLRARGRRNDEVMADYIDFACTTGLRVEEALRLTSPMFLGLGTDKPSLSVPGLKTSTSQRTLPLYPLAAELALRLVEQAGQRGRLFPVSYRALQRVWVECREHLGLADMSTCTLKALRRSFGRVATESGMPTEILRDYYRHASLKTTSEYLMLIGGYETERIRQWVPKGPTHSTPYGSSSSRSSPTEACA
ncbi:MAG: site-specific integrase [Pseudomonadota bacterium]